MWDPKVYGEDLVMAARVAPLALPPGSCWSDFEGLPPALGVCVLVFGEALASVMRVVALLARLPCCGSQVPQLAPGPVGPTPGAATKHAAAALSSKMPHGGSC